MDRSATSGCAAWSWPRRSRSSASRTSTPGVTGEKEEEEDKEIVSGPTTLLAFFWEQHKHRLAVCMLAHGRLGDCSRWGQLNAGVPRMVLGSPIHYGGV